jgi:tRNA(Ile)-lysidine synthase
VIVGAHPAVAAVRHAVRISLTRTNRPALVACSGGTDSVALAAATAFVAPRLGRTAGLVTVDHGIQAGSERQARQVAALGYELGLDPVEIVIASVGTSGGPEAAARTARYAALDAVADALGADVLLGHTLDDQAETVLLGLGRGSGPRSIAGMRAADGHYLRPLLEIRRVTTAAACTALGLSAWDDPHNIDPSFQRSRLRHEALPLLESILQGGVAEALARTAQLLRSDLDALDAIAASAYRGVISSGGATALDVTELATYPTAVRTRILRIWAAERGTGPLTSAHLGELDGLIVNWHGQGDVDLPGGYVASRASGRLHLQPRRSAAPKE